MGHFSGTPSIQGTLYNWLMLFTISLCSFRDVLSQQMALKTDSHVPSKFELSEPPTTLFDPKEISPAVVPRNPYPVEPLSPMYPSFPSTYVPVLTGRCPGKFADISSIIDKTASDCSAPLAALVGNVICCPQVNSLMHIFQGAYSNGSDGLVLQKAAAEDCFSDIISILASRGANNTIPTLCSVNSRNLTGGSCPVKDTATFEKTVNTSKLLDSCSSVDPLKECCRPICQPAIMEAALHISLRDSSPLESSNIPGSAIGIDILSDCKGVVYAWLSRKLSAEAANTAFRMLSSCKVNKVCPLEFKEPSNVIKACRDLASPNPSCCSSLNTYIADIQKQMLITNRQAINCATLFGSMLQKGGVMTDVFELCDVDLKDFSLQAYGQQGCLLRSSPADVIYDNFTGFSFTCDLSDNIAAPWPSSSSLSSLSLCAPEMSLPALPVSQNSGASGSRETGVGVVVLILFWVVLQIYFI
uniref:Putative GPI-anchored protein At1g61900 n=1 Tax=Anthurium amnicola TaxID=1678845 RepID=A0A1D1YDF2_9ARAE